MAVLTAREFRFSRKPWTTTEQLKPDAALGPWTRILLGMKPGEFRDLGYTKYKALMSAAYRRSVPHKSEKLSKNRWRFTRIA